MFHLRAVVLAVIATCAVAQKQTSNGTEDLRILRIINSMEKRLQNLEESSSRFSHLETWIDTINKRFDTIDSALSFWTQKSGKLEDFAKTEESFASWGRFPVTEDKFASKMDSLSADVLSGIDDVMEKVLRLEERLIIHERSSKQQLEKLSDSLNSALELTASLKTEFTTETRKATRVLENRILTLSSKIEQELNKFLYSVPLLPKKDKDTVEKSSKRNVNQSEASDVQSLLRRVRTNRSRAAVFAEPKSSSFHRMKQRDGPFMDAAAAATPPPFTRLESRLTNRKDYEVDADLQFSNEGINCSLTEFIQNVSLIVESSFSKHLQQQTNLVTTKLANMYEELWRQGKILGSELFIIGNVINQTKTHMDEGFRTLLYQQDKSIVANLPGTIPAEYSASLDAISKEFTASINQKLSDLDERVHVELEALRLTQTGLIETCHRANYEQQWDSLLEFLEKLLLIMESNSHSSQKETATVKAMLQKHSELVENFIERSSALTNEVTVTKNSTKGSAAENEVLRQSKKKDVLPEDEEEKNAETQDYTYVDPDEQNE